MNVGKTGVCASAVGPASDACLQGGAASPNQSPLSHEKLELKPAVTTWIGASTAELGKQEKMLHDEAELAAAAPSTSSAGPAVPAEAGAKSDVSIVSKFVALRCKYGRGAKMAASDRHQGER